MAVIYFTQNDTLPAIRTWLHQGKVVDGALPIDVSQATVRANIGFDGVLKDTIVCLKAPGLYQGEDKRTGLWNTPIVTAPYNVTGAGGIVLMYPNAATFNKVGVYQVEYEITFPGGVQTIYQTDEIHVRPQLG